MWDKTLQDYGYQNNQGQFINNTATQMGNIDLSQRPQVTNPDGSISTVRSKSFNINGKEVLLPTISPDGRNLTDQEAIDLYKQTGQDLGAFNTVDEANKVAQNIHDQQATQTPQNSAALVGTQGANTQQGQTPTTENKTPVNVNTEANNAQNPAQSEAITVSGNPVATGSKFDSVLGQGITQNQQGQLMNRGQYYDALLKDGVKNPFIREILYDKNIAPLEAETRRQNLENAYRTYLDPKASAEQKEAAKTMMAVLLNNPTYWEDRADAKAKADEELSLKRQKLAMDNAYKQQSLIGKYGSGGNAGAGLVQAFGSMIGQDGTISTADGVVSDCIGKIGDAIRAMGIEWTDSRTTDGVYEWAQQKYGIWDKGAQDANVGDIVIGNANNGKGYADGHAAVYAGNGKWIHVASSHDRQIAETDNPFYSIYGIIRTSRLGIGKGGTSGTRSKSSSSSKEKIDTKAYNYMTPEQKQQYDYMVAAGNKKGATAFIQKVSNIAAVSAMMGSDKKLESDKAVDFLKNQGLEDKEIESIIGAARKNIADKVQAIDDKNKQQEQAKDTTIANSKFEDDVDGKSIKDDYNLATQWIGYHNPYPRGTVQFERYIKQLYGYPEHEDVRAIQDGGFLRSIIEYFQPLAPTEGRIGNEDEIGSEAQQKALQNIVISSDDAGSQGDVGWQDDKDY